MFLCHLNNIKIQMHKVQKHKCTFFQFQSKKRFTHVQNRFIQFMLNRTVRQHLRYNHISIHCSHHGNTHLWAKSMMHGITNWCDFCNHKFHHLCLCVYVYICIYVYVYMCICVYVYMCICVYVYMCICVYVYLNVEISC